MASIHDVTTRSQIRRDYKLDPLSDEWYAEMQKHPDLRLVSVPYDLLIEDDEVLERYGSGYVVGDGAYYDPCNDEFVEILTI